MRIIKTVAIIAALGLGLAAMSWKMIVNPDIPAVDPAVAARAQITLYATAWCGYCAKTRDLFEKAGVAFVEFDIEKSPEGARQYEALGAQGVPISVINGEVVRGYNPTRLLKLINES